MYHTQITAQGVFNTFRHKILEVTSEHGTINDVYHVSRAILQPAQNENQLPVKIYHAEGNNRDHTVVLFRPAFLLALLNTHNATSNYGGTIGNVTMKLYNDYE